MMTAQDFTIIADLLRGSRNQIQPEVVLYGEAVAKFCLGLRDNNPQFDWEQFAEACGIDRRSLTWRALNVLFTNVDGDPDFDYWSAVAALEAAQFDGITE